MKICLLVLSLIGLGCAFQAPLTYKYDYEAQVITGIPSVGPQVAATGLKAQVVVCMKSKESAVVKLENVQVGVYHEDAGVDMRHAISMSYKPVSGEGKHLEEPFIVNFLKQSDNVMMVSKSEPVWVTNIKKAIANPLRSAPLRGQMGSAYGDTSSNIIKASRQGKSTPFFRIMEDTILGRCESEYTLIKMPEHWAEVERTELKKSVTKDEEGEGAKGPQGKFENTLYKAVRSINLDRCEDHVVVQHTQVGNGTKNGFGHMNYLQSRGSVASFILQGSLHNLRLVRANIEGRYTSQPFGYKTEVTETVSNQTLRLVSVGKDAAIAPPSSPRPVKTWLYEVESPFSAPSVLKRSWVDYKGKGQQEPLFVQSSISGFTLTPSLRSQFKSQVIASINKAVQAMVENPKPVSGTFGPFDSEAGQIVSSLHRASTLCQGLSKQELEQVYTQMMQGSDDASQLKKTMTIDVLAAAGTEHAIELLLEKMEKTEISVERQATIFITLTNNIRDSVAIKSLAAYIKRINMEENPFLATAAYTSVATMMRRQCIHQHSKNFTVPTPLLGNRICTRSDTSEFLSFIEQKLKSSSKSWEQTVLVQTLGNLGSVETLRALRPIICGQSTRDSMVRSTSLKAIGAQRMPQAARSEVFDILMPIVENIEEDVEIRQQAVRTLLGYHPDMAWWYRMAQLTWREASKQMAGYVYSTIHSVSQFNDPHLKKQTKFASQVIHSARPVMPSLRFSWDKMTSTMFRPIEVQTTGGLSWINDMESAFPREVAAFLEACFGGYHFRLFEMQIAAEGLQSLLPRASSTQQAYVSPQDHAGRTAQEHHQRFMDTAAPTITRPHHHHHRAQANLFLKFLDNMEVLLPLNSETLQKTFLAKPEIFAKLTQGMRFHSSKYINPVVSSVAFPLDCGLAAQELFSTPTTKISEGTIQIRTPGEKVGSWSSLLRAKEVVIEVDANYRIINKISSVVKVDVPYLQKSLVVGADSVKNLNIPGRFTLSVHKSSAAQSVAFAIKPNFTSETPVVHAHTYAIAEIKNMIPVTDVTQDGTIKVIHVDKDKRPLVKENISFGNVVAGLKSTINYEGDVDSPFTPTKMVKYLRDPQRIMGLLANPTMRSSRVTWSVDPSGSETKEVTAKITLLTPSRLTSKPSVTEEGMLATDTDEVRAVKLEKILKSSQNLRSVRMLVDFAGEQAKNNKIYEATVAYGQESESSTRAIKTIVALMRSDIPQYAQAGAACLVVDAKMPILRDLQSLKTALESDPQISAQGQLHVGAKCSSAPEIAEVQTRLSVSSERRAVLKREIAGQDPSIMLSNAPTSKFSVPAVYDRGQFDITVKGQLPESLWNVTYTVEDILRGLATPHVYENRLVQNEQTKFSAVGQRTMESERWSFWTKMPTKTVLVDNIRIPRVVDNLLPVGGIYTPLSEMEGMLVLASSLSSENECLINTRQVKTYDGKTIAWKKPLTCWTIATVDLSKPDGFKAEVRGTEAERVEGRIVDHSSRIVVRHNQIEVDGRLMVPNEGTQDVKNSKGQVIGSLKKFGASGVEFVLTNQCVMIVTQESVRVSLSEQHRSAVRGICGSFDGRGFTDMEGPQTCLYNDNTLFTYAWTVQEPVPGCSQSVLSDIGSRVTQYQRHCTHIGPRNSTSAASTFMSESSLKRVYAVEKVGGKYCVTQEPQTQCVESFHAQQYITKECHCNCFTEDKAPEHVKAAASTGGSGYVSRPVSERSASSVQTVPIRVPRANACVHS